MFFMGDAGRGWLKWLWLRHFQFPGWWSGTSILFLLHRLGIPSSQLTFIFFRGLKPPTRYNYGLFNLISSDMRWYFPTTMGKNLEKYLQVLQPVNLGWVVINPSSFGTGIWGFPESWGYPQAHWMFYNRKSQLEIRMMTGGTPMT